MKTLFRTVEEIMLTALREEARLLLPLCTPKQIEFFNTIHGIDSLTINDFKNVIPLIQRTIKRNEEEKSIKTKSRYEIRKERIKKYLRPSEKPDDGRKAVAYPRG